MVPTQHSIEDPLNCLELPFSLSLCSYFEVGQILSALPVVTGLITIPKNLNANC